MTDRWDDAAFKAKIRRAAKQKGVTLRDALLAAGVSQSYLDKSGTGRSTDTVYRLASVLDVSPAYLFGIEELQSASSVPNGHSEDADKLVRISLYTKIIAAQLATLVYMASDHSDEESKALMDFVLRLIDQVSNNVERGGKIR